MTNDFSIRQLGEVVIVTGSNMSGKSTFLRTLGTNLCLAFAGGPVNADGMRTGLFRLFTCIQVSDLLAGDFLFLRRSAPPESLAGGAGAGGSPSAVLPDRRDFSRDQ